MNYKRQGKTAMRERIGKNKQNEKRKFKKGAKEKNRIKTVGKREEQRNT